eukprot:gene25649-biopygen1474
MLGLLERGSRSVGREHSNPWISTALRRTRRCGPPRPLRAAATFTSTFDFCFGVLRGYALRSEEGPSVRGAAAAAAAAAAATAVKMYSLRGAKRRFGTSTCTRTDGRADGRTGGRTDGRADGRVGRRTGGGASAVIWLRAVAPARGHRGTREQQRGLWCVIRRGALISPAFREFAPRCEPPPARAKCGPMIWMSSGREAAGEALTPPQLLTGTPLLRSLATGPGTIFRGIVEPCPGCP